MRVVLLNDKRAERESTGRALEDAACRVEMVGSTREALAAIAREPADVIVAIVNGEGAADVVGLLHKANRSRDPYLLAVLEGAPRQWDIPMILAAGANDVMRAPIASAELVARVRAPKGLVRRSREPRAAVTDRSGAAVVRGLRAWRSLATLVVQDIAQMVGQPLRASEGAPRVLDGRTRGATLTMSLVSAKIEVRLSVFATQANLPWLGKTLVDDPGVNETTMDDVLRELANVAGGAFKRAALAENVTLTTGIPVNDHTLRAEGRDVRYWTVIREDGAPCLALVGDILSFESQRVPASSLREGMILTHDLRSESGQLLVTAGSRLTGTTASRLAKILAPGTFVEVACGP